MIYKRVLVPDENNHSIEMPERFFGKKVAVIVTEIDNAPNYPVPPAGKGILVDELFENFGASPEFPSIEEIRTKAWPSKW